MKNIKKKRKNKVDKRPKFDVMAIPCKTPFVISAEKAEDFLNQKTDPEVRRKIHEMAAKFEKNNLID